MSVAFNGADFCWMNGEVIETEKALVSAMEPIHLGIFEGIKAPSVFEMQIPNA